MTSIAGATTREFFNTPFSAALLENLHVPYTVRQILTGQSKLNSFLSRFLEITSSQCSCLIEEETISHFLF